MKYFIILLLSIPYYSFSQESQYKRIQSQCLDRDWSKESCQYVDDEQGYAEGGGAFGFVVTNVVSGFAEILQYGYESIGTPTVIPFKTSTGAIKRESVISLITGYLNKNRISSCQKACLIKCVSSKVLNYVPNVSTKLGTLEDVYKSEKGVCTEFSRVFDDLAYKFDIASRKIDSFTMAHSFNKIKIDGRWVYLEPQDPDCKFYTKKPEEFSNKKNINSSNRSNPKYEFNPPADKTGVKKSTVIKQ